MKQVKNILAAAALLALPIAFTSCEDVLGHWEKPVPATPAATTEEEEPAVVAAADQYLKWSTADNKLVVEDIPAGYITMESSTTTWNSNYIVESDVTITGDVTISGDANIILKDGVTLTVNGRVAGVNKLCIFAQNSDATAAGKLVIAPTSMAGSASSALSVSELQIHGGDITATGHDNSTAAGDDGLKTTGKMFIYAGKVTATGGAHDGGSTSGGIGIICSGNELHIYKAEVSATGGNTNSSGSSGYGISCGGESLLDPQLVIDGGTVTAKAGDATGATAGIVSTKLTVNSGKLLTQGNSSSGKGFNGSVMYLGAGLTAKGGSDGVNYPYSYSNNSNPADRYLKVE